jgi:hypothetical protein
MGVGQNSVDLRRLKSEIAHEAKIAIVIKLVRLAVKLFYELPETHRDRRQSH